MGGRSFFSPADRGGNGGALRTQGRPRRRQRRRHDVFAARRRVCRGHRVVGAGRKGGEIDGAAARRGDPVRAQRSGSQRSASDERYVAAGAESRARRVYNRSVIYTARGRGCSGHGLEGGGVSARGFWNSEIATRGGGAFG